MKTIRVGRMLVTAVLGVLLLPGWSQAQESRRILISDLPLAEQIRIRAQKEAREGEAAELYRQARQAEQIGDWGRAARLYEESGDMRPDGDRLSVTSYALAARAYFYDGEVGRASLLWEEAGNRALTVGDVLEAARSYLHAAVAAHEKRDSVRSVELGWRAYRLTESDLLSSQERDLIRRHLRVRDGDRG